MLESMKSFYPQILVFYLNRISNSKEHLCVNVNRIVLKILEIIVDVETVEVQLTVITVGAEISAILEEKAILNLEITDKTKANVILVERLETQEQTQEIIQEIKQEIEDVKIESNTI